MENTAHCTSDPSIGKDSGGLTHFPAAFSRLPSKYELGRQKTDSTLGSKIAPIQLEPSNAPQA